MKGRKAAELVQALRRIDGRGYKSYRDIEGEWAFEDFRLTVDHVQADPFAAPSRCSVHLLPRVLGLPEELLANPHRRRAVEDFLMRSFCEAAKRHARGSRGSGKGGRIEADRPGQEVLTHTAAAITDEGLSFRFRLGLPAHGRRVAARDAREMLLDELPRIVEASLMGASLPLAELERHAFTVEDSVALREGLEEAGLLAFVADGAVLPRRSGVDDRPAQGEAIVPFRSPPSLRVSLETPNSGAVQGMGIPRGVTLIVGGGYHGKSTLLKALELGVYDHIPGDGRERVVCEPQAVKIRAEDGRRVAAVDISPFISHLPLGVDTERFSTEDASGSTSQAAAIMEALELGARTLLVDEDTSATNFMIRDRRMQALVSAEREPITPFVDRVEQLYREREVSTVLVLGGSGDYFDVAQKVICMVDYEPHDLSAQAREIAERFPTGREVEGLGPFAQPRARIPRRESFDARRGRREAKVSARGLSTLSFGRHDVDLAAVEQLVHPAQTRAMGEAMLALRSFMDGRDLKEAIEALMEELQRDGLERLSRYPRGDMASFRSFELAAAVNRLRCAEF